MISKKLCIEFFYCISGEFPGHASGVYHSIPGRGLQMGVSGMESVAWASNWAVNPATQCSKCLFSRSWHRFILLLLFFDAWYVRELLRFSLFPCNDYTEHIQIYVHFRRIRRTLYIRRPSPLSYRDTNKAYIADHFRHKCHRFLH